MQEFFFTLLTIWVLFKVFGSVGRTQHYTFNTQNNYREPFSKQDKEIRVDHPSQPPISKRKTDEGEYIDFEEIKD